MPSSFKELGRSLLETPNAGVCYDDGMKDKKLVPFLAALCLFLSALEYAVPKPLPFLRVGFANLPLLLALGKLCFSDMLLLVLLKTVGQGFVSGTAFSYVFLFSGAGTFASMLAMVAVRRLSLRAGRGERLVGFVGLNMAGALASNAAQLLLARFMLFGQNARYIAPALLSAGSASALLLGLFAGGFARVSRWYASLPAADSA
ncbi:Gx transporter family protein [Treponema endosymbiont of Eucomonympha sp.]|uniref:Gx transporter family protein n=1 Tax=Treponema endosymbiont of Eucomonympha sp. TaxID=1580831 RepID=UPI001396BC85|nr:Gx transporter family protein [Treponema endosymbiont of Eucomonympha sp.]